MRIFVPFTNLRVETYLSVPNAILVPLKDKEHGYGKYLWERWKESQPFINVEHDVVPTQEMIKGLWECQETFCVTSYSENEGPSLLGCVKFSEKFISGTQGIFDNYPNWKTCDNNISKACLDMWHNHGVVHHVH